MREWGQAFHRSVSTGGNSALSQPLDSFDKEYHLTKHFDNRQWENVAGTVDIFRSEGSFKTKRRPLVGGAVETGS